MSLLSTIGEDGHKPSASDSYKKFRYVAIELNLDLGGEREALSGIPHN